jgi:hypothetical protein
LVRKSRGDQSTLQTARAFKWKSNKPTNAAASAE